MLDGLDTAFMVDDGDGIGIDGMAGGGEIVLYISKRYLHLAERAVNGAESDIMAVHALIHERELLVDAILEKPEAFVDRIEALPYGENELPEHGLNGIELCLHDIVVHTHTIPRDRS